jgi:FkbM family methyltransferase
MLDHITVHETNEALTRAVYNKIVEPGDHVIDLGAHVGHHTRELSRLVGPGGIVHAFEPNIDHFQALLAIGANVRLWPFAAGNELQTVKLHVPRGLDGWASIQDIRAELADRTFDIIDTIQVCIDDLSEIEQAKITFIKADVERRELYALLGMPKLLRAARPTLVIENVSGEILALLSRLDYLVTDLYGGDWNGRHHLPNSVAFPLEKRVPVTRLLWTS